MKNKNMKEALAKAKSWIKGHKKLVAGVGLVAAGVAIKIAIDHTTGTSDSRNVYYVNAEDICMAYGLECKSHDEAVEKAVREYTWSKDFLTAILTQAGINMETKIPEAKEIVFYTAAD